MAVFFLLNDNCVIHIPEPYPWRVGGSVDGHDLNSAMTRCVFEAELPTM